MLQEEKLTIWDVQKTQSTHVVGYGLSRVVTNHIKRFVEVDKAYFENHVVCVL